MRYERNNIITSKAFTVLIEWVLYLLWGQAPHVGRFKNVLEILGQIYDIGVDSNLCGNKAQKNKFQTFPLTKWRLTATICKKKSPDTKTCLIFPLKFSPHLSELDICAGGWLNVVHDINVNVTEDYAVPVTGCS